MDTSRLKKFAQYARRSLLEQVQSKLNLVLAVESETRRESPKAIAELESKLEELGREQLIEQVAYVWFNRFCALRFMDVNQYNRIMVISPLPGQFQPEILAEAKAGHIDEKTVSVSVREKIFGLLGGSIASRDGQSEAFRLLIVAVCNELHSVMPYMFERIDNYTELLMPQDLFSGNSILAYTREAMTPEACESVETIGWLYQFYISEKKDNVFAALKKGKKVTPKNIPAATQLFTPHWIVRYLVENSLGRLWMLNYPDSKLVEQMDYYIKPEEPEIDFLKISSPEEIKICDPACGSGHMLTYAFDLLYAIYEEQDDHQVTDIPQLILTHNLYGIEIDQRAGALAAFALTMKAREKYRRFLTGDKTVQPNICVLENIRIQDHELSSYMDQVGRDLFTHPLEDTLKQFEEADNFGSLIRPLVTDVREVLELLRERQMGENLFLVPVHQDVLKALRQADYLSPKYHIVVANPPYMGTSGLNDSMREFSASFFEHSKEDLYCMFIERFAELSGKNGIAAFITMHSWMFGERYRRFRPSFLGENSIICLAHFGAHAFDSIGGEVVQTAATVIQAKQDNRSTVFHRLVAGEDEAAKREMLLKDANRYELECSRFAAIDGWPIVYWLPMEMLELFNTLPRFYDTATPRKGMVTGDNDRFIRYWFEVSSGNTSLTSMSRDESVASQTRWFPYTKGGTFRKWFGNQEFVVNWQNDGDEMRNNPHSSGTRNAGSNFNLDFIFREGITWNNISSSSVGFRFQPAGSLFDQKGSMLFSKGISHFNLLAYLNCSVASLALSGLCPTLDINSGSISKLPYDESVVADTTTIQRAVEVAESDWNASEMSSDFSTLPLIPTSRECQDIRERWKLMRNLGQQQVRELMEIESANNRNFANGYGLPENVLSCVQQDEIGLSVNPAYRYDDDKSESELEALLLADTMREFISYGVGCMLGRYSLDKPGLILANQGETADDYLKHVPDPTFAPDEENVIPLLDGDWFEDDIGERFKEFLKVTFGTEHFDENLTFLEDALYPDNLNGKKRKTIRDYFLKEFYSHHVKLYKKRPIYWLFSSPKGSFNALIYMHRYRPDTVSVVLNDYLREFRAKLEARKESLVQVEVSVSASPSDKTNAIKQIRKVDQILVEIKDYENTLYQYASNKIEINLDNGVKHNYPLFGKALKKVPGLS